MKMTDARIAQHSRRVRTPQPMTIQRLRSGWKDSSSAAGSAGEGGATRGRGAAAGAGAGDAAGAGAEAGAPGLPAGDTIVWAAPSPTTSYTTVIVSPRPIRSPLLSW